jgi:large subunit ribosomal protein L24
MKAKLKVRRDDVVVVISGKHKGKVGKIVRVHPLEGRVVVEGVARVKRHVKAQGEQAGSIVEKEAAIHVSNVALWNAEEGRRVKVGFAVSEDGTKTRIDRKTGAAV